MRDNENDFITVGQQIMQILRRNRHFNAELNFVFHKSALMMQISGLNRITNQWEEIGHLTEGRYTHTAIFPPLDLIKKCH